MTPPPDLSRLTEAEKDALILALWARVAELEARLNAPPKTPDNSSLPPSRGRWPLGARIPFKPKGVGWRPQAASLKAEAPGIWSRRKGRRRAGSAGFHSPQKLQTVPVMDGEV
jgi:hypothetical protein